jgi:hypothetical protein
VEGLFKDGNAPLSGHQPDETDLADGEQQGLAMERKVSRQLAEALTPLVLSAGSLPEVPMDVLLIDAGHETVQFASHLGWAPLGAVEQQRLEPPLHGSTEPLC